jgi:hypothetical protein
MYTPPTIWIYGKQLSPSTPLGRCLFYGAIPLVIASAAYLGYLIASVIGHYLGWYTVPTGLLILLLTGSFTGTWSGPEREIALLPKTARNVVLGALLLVTLATLAVDGRFWDFTVGFAWALNHIMSKAIPE